MGESMQLDGVERPIRKGGVLIWNQDTTLRRYKLTKLGDWENLACFDELHLPFHVLSKVCLWTRFILLRLGTQSPCALTKSQRGPRCFSWPSHPSPQARPLLAWSSRRK